MFSFALLIFLTRKIIFLFKFKVPRKFSINLEKDKDNLEIIKISKNNFKKRNKDFNPMINWDG